MYDGYGNVLWKLPSTTCVHVVVAAIVLVQVDHAGNFCSWHAEKWSNQNGAYSRRLLLVTL